MKIKHRLILKSFGFGTLATALTFNSPAYALTSEDIESAMKKYCIPPETTNCDPNHIAKYTKDGCICENDPGAIWNPATRECFKCKPGTYLKNQTDTECTDCPAGYKCAGGLAKPVLCPAGTYNTTTGNETCTICEAGYACAGGTNHTQCPAGKYNNGTGNTSCTTCEAGYACSGGSDHRQCPVGYYSPGGSKVSCAKCSDTTYGSWSASCGSSIRTVTTYCSQEGSSSSTSYPSYTTQSGNAGSCSSGYTCKNGSCQKNTPKKTCKLDRYFDCHGDGPSCTSDAGGCTCSLYINNRETGYYISTDQYYRPSYYFQDDYSSCKTALYVDGSKWGTISGNWTTNGDYS